MDNNRFDNFMRRVIKNEIMDRIISQGTFTIMDIVDSTDVSPTTVSKYVFEMQQDNIIEAVDNVKTDRRGRRPMLYGIKSNYSFFIGVDVKYSSIRVGLMNISGKLLNVTENNSFHLENTYLKYEEVCSYIDEYINSLDDAIRTQIACICFSIGGRVNADKGTSASWFNFEEMHGDSLASVLESRFGHKVVIENDTKAMTYGEYIALKGAKVKNMLYVNVGWGLGLGIIIDGKLVSGQTGYAGEYGHLPYYNNDVICHCGKKGCVETEISGLALNRKLAQRIKNGEQSILSKKVLSSGDVTIKDILFAAEKEDPLCVDLITKMASELGRHIAGLINIFNPGAIMVGGAIAEAASYYFMHPMADSIRKYSLRLINEDVKIMRSSLGENAGVYGACMYARNKTFISMYLLNG